MISLLCPDLTLASVKNNAKASVTYVGAEIAPKICNAKEMMQLNSLQDCPLLLRREKHALLAWSPTLKVCQLPCQQALLGISYHYRDLICAGSPASLRR